MKYLALAAMLLVGPLSLRADQWTFFHAEAVKSCSCKAVLISLQNESGPPGRDMWEAEATAVRTDPSLGDWTSTVGRYEPKPQKDGTDKGLDSANKACMQWLHEAQKRMKKARTP